MNDSLRRVTPEQRRDGGVDVGDGRRANGADLGDQPEEEQERDSGAEDGEPDDRQEYAPGRERGRQLGRRHRGVPDRAHDQRSRDHSEARQVPEPAHEDDWPDRIADGDASDLQHGEAARPLGVEPDERGHADEPEQQAAGAGGRRAVSSSSPLTVVMAAPTSGTAARSNPVNELDTRFSAVPSSSHGAAISIAAKASKGRQQGRSAPSSRRRIAIGSRISAPSAVRPKTSVAGVSSRTATRIMR